MAGRLSNRVQQLSVRTDTKTKDDVTVAIVTAVQYRVINTYIAPTNEAMNRDGEAHELSAVLPPAGRTVEDHGAWRAYYRLTGVTQQFQAYIEDVVRSEIPLKTLDDAYACKNDIAHAVKDQLQREMREYGYEIINALVTGRHQAWIYMIQYPRH
jgi:regulator of protease activity HflC (stomatin/prohibitin superfamily)